MDDPDKFELEEAEGIGIFEPGMLLEDQVNKNQMFGVLGYTALGMILMVGVTIVMMIPLMLSDLIIIDFYSGVIIRIDPLAMLILTFAELSFVVPPLYYIRKHGLPRSAIGIKNILSSIDIGLGVAFGAALLGANFFISWIISIGTGPTPPGAEELLVARNWTEMAAWFFAMFVLVGFTEELIFRGFMQRRMEMYFRVRGTTNYKIVALVISSFIFAAIHLDIIGLPTRFVLGVFLGFLAQQRNYNIIGPSIAHGINNGIVVFLISLPNLLPGLF
ncbi:MAG: lysostaphin resistance A-like protein [Candidatus Thorarchaeota archaeon]